MTALRIRVPGIVKRTLTSMQITQFLFGTTMAAAYLFVSYTIPTEPNTAAAAATSWLKKVGAIATDPSTTHHPQMTHCLHSSGQGFAVWLNVSYLLPLTVLFLRFFVRSYLSRKEPSAPQPTHIHAAERAGMEALRDVSREIQKSVEVHGETSEATEDEYVKAKAKVAGLTKAKPENGTAGAAKAEAQGEGDADKDSPIRTRSTAKRTTRQTQTPEPRGKNPPETSNPYDVLRS